ncbi:RCC1 domain-containing protein [Leucobacter sp. M11]|uniref:RCC1 domain-containing protein n=1 Tax=Leucobacter sp. M11 TaxID=2993565 RepID=UPI002D808BBB|nr:hypothetical protein [Leucobacter sp. M11]MEB4615577.1 hypothetical protein [Leucobacter sp. M11]
MFRLLGAAVALIALFAAGAGAVRVTEAAYLDTAVAQAESYTTPAEYTAVSTQFASTSVALSDGWVWIWGTKGRGMGGNGVADQRDPSPDPVYGLPAVTKVVGASDLNDTYGTFGALTASGEVYTWGANQYGRLGIGRPSGASDFRSTPQRVTMPDGSRVIDIGSMRATIAVLTENGDVYTWGSGQYGQAGNGQSSAGDGPNRPFLVVSNVHSMHVGQRVTWVVTRDNEVFWWGRSYTGEAGNGTGTTTNRSRPTALPPLTAFARGCEGPAVAEYDPSNACSIRAITSSRWAGAMLLDTGELRTFGSTERGQVGRGGARLQVLPVAIGGPVTQVSAGNYHFTALTEAGEAWGWGDNSQWAATGNVRQDGSLGQGTRNAEVPFRLPLRGLVAVGGSRDTSYATRNDSVLIGWGDGRLGAIPGQERPRQSFAPLALPGIRITELGP